MKSVCDHIFIFEIATTTRKLNTEPKSQRLK